MYFKDSLISGSTFFIIVINNLDFFIDNKSEA